MQIRRKRKRHTPAQGQQRQKLHLEMFLLQINGNKTIELCECKQRQGNHYMNKDPRQKNVCKLK